MDKSARWPINNDTRANYRSDGLHAQDKCVLRQVARIRKGVLLPQLSKQCLQRAHVGLIESVVALEEEVYAAA